MEIKIKHHTDTPDPCKCGGVIEAQIVDQDTGEVLDTEQFDLFRGKYLEAIYFSNCTTYPDEEASYPMDCRIADTEFELDELGREVKPIATRCTIEARDAWLRDGASLSNLRDRKSEYQTAMGSTLARNNGGKFRDFWAKRENYPGRNVHVKYSPGLCKAGSWVKALAPQFTLDESTCYNLKAKPVSPGQPANKPVKSLT